MAENKLPVAVVTGVGPGLGAALARRFAKGYAVAINARKTDFIASVAKEIPRRWRQCHSRYQGDIGDPKQTAAMFKLDSRTHRYLPRGPALQCRQRRHSVRLSTSALSSTKPIGASMRWEHSYARRKSHRI